MWSRFPRGPVNIYSTYDEKIPGTYALVLDESIRNVNREIAPTTHQCRAHRYPIVVGDALAVSIKRTLDSIFESVIESSVVPGNDRSPGREIDGTILVRLDDLSPRVTCSPGFWGATCMASTDISFGISVRNSAGALVSTLGGRVSNIRWKCGFYVQWGCRCDRRFPN